MRWGRRKPASPPPETAAPETISDTVTRVIVLNHVLFQLALEDACKKALKEELLRQVRTSSTLAA